MVWTSSGAVGVLARCLSRLLDRSGAGVVLGKLRNLGVAAALTALIVLMVVVASAGTGLVRRLHVDSVLLRVAVPLGTAAIAMLICAAFTGRWQAGPSDGGRLSGAALSRV
jgi:uncharacterized BrkB/YihY/UPF0761 family membrane protein